MSNHSCGDRKGLLTESLRSQFCENSEFLDWLGDNMCTSPIFHNFPVGCGTDAIVKHVFAVKSMNHPTKWDKNYKQTFVSLGEVKFCCQIS